MKKITFILLMLVSGTVFGQTATSATATADIITALKIEKAADMVIGKIAPLSDATSTFILKTDGTADAAGDATDIDDTGRKAASFTITGDDSQTFSVTLPTSVTLTGGTGAGMVLTLDPSLAATGNTISSGSATLNIGGSLALAQNQGSGTYSATINVSVAYE